MKNLKKLLISSMLATSMTLGAVAPTLAAAAEATPVEKNYVALGDSMTNGYGFGDYNLTEDKMETSAAGYGNLAFGETMGFDGYGFHDHSINYYNQLYPYLVKHQLEELHKDENWQVNVFQYAISAMRPEELHFLLSFDYTQEYDNDTLEAYVRANGDSYLKNSWLRTWLLRKNRAWDEDEITPKDPEEENPEETPDPYAELEMDTDTIADEGVREIVNKIIYDKNNKDTTVQPFSAEDIAKVQGVAKDYQDAVKNADYISVNIGSNSFFNFFLNELFDIINGDNPGYKFDTFEQLYGENAFIKNTAEKLYSTANAALLKLLGSGNAGTVKMIERLVGCLVYSYVGMIKNYEKALNDIVSLSERKVTVSLIGLSNIFRGVIATIGNIKVDLGDIVGIFLDSVNSSFATLAANANKKVALRWNKPYTVNVVNTFIREDGTKSDKINTFYDSYTTLDKDGNIYGINEKIHDDYMPSFASSVWPVIKKAFPEVIAQNYYKLSSEVEVYAYYKNNNITEKTGRIGLTMAMYGAYEKAAKTISGSADENGNRYFSLNKFVDILSGTLDVSNLKDSAAAIFSDAIVDGKIVEEYDFSQVEEALAEWMIADDDVRTLIYIYNNYLGGSRAIHPDEVGHADYARSIVKSFEKGSSPAAYFAGKIVKIATAPLRLAINSIRNIFSRIFSFWSRVF